MTHEPNPTRQKQNKKKETFSLRPLQIVAILKQYWIVLRVGHEITAKYQSLTYLKYFEWKKLCHKKHGVNVWHYLARKLFINKGHKEQE